MTLLYLDAVKADQIVARRIDRDDVGPVSDLFQDLAVIDLDMDLSVTVKTRNETVPAGYVYDIVPALRLKEILRVLCKDIDRIVCTQDGQDIVTGSHVLDAVVVAQAARTDKASAEEDRTVTIHHDRTVLRREDFFDIAHFRDLTGFRILIADTLHSSVGIYTDDMGRSRRDIRNILPFRQRIRILGDQTRMADRTVVVQDDRKPFSFTDFDGSRRSQVGQLSVGVASGTVDTGVVIDIDDCRLGNGQPVDIVSDRDIRSGRILQYDGKDDDRKYEDRNDRTGDLVLLIEIIRLLKERLLPGEVIDIDLIRIGFIDII